MSFGMFEVCSVVVDCVVNGDIVVDCELSIVVDCKLSIVVDCEISVVVASVVAESCP